MINKNTSDHQVKKNIYIKIYTPISEPLFAPPWPGSETNVFVNKTDMLVMSLEWCAINL